MHTSNKIIQFSGKLSISRVHSNMEDDFIEITLEDSSSGDTVLVLKLSPSELGEALTGRRDRPCEAKLYDAHIGKIIEHKTELIKAPEKYVSLDKQKETARSLFKDYEVDGWVGRPTDLFNSHRFRDGKQLVQFYRYVDAPAPEWQIEAKRLKDAGELIAAIKHCRSITGWGLKQAKEEVDKL